MGLELNHGVCPARFNETDGLDIRLPHEPNDSWDENVEGVGMWEHVHACKHCNVLYVEFSR